MKVDTKAATMPLSGAFALGAGAWLAVGAAAGLGQEAREEVRPGARVLWLADLGAESLAVRASPPTTASSSPVVIPVPGAVYVFDRRADGTLHKRLRLPADSAAAHGLALAGPGLALADRTGVVSFWTLSPAGGTTLRWRRELGDRVTSVGWKGGPVVLAATWSGRMTALSSEDGAVLWSVDLGGRADAPAVFDEDVAFVATKAGSLLGIGHLRGDVRWRARLPGLVVHPPVLLDGRPRRVVCGTLDGQLVAFSATTGHPSWSVQLEGRLASGPVAGPGSVAAVTADGSIRSYDPAGRLSWVARSAAEGPATLLWQETPGIAPRLLSVSKVLVSLEPSTGERLADYPQGALAELEQRFADAMLEGEKTYSEAEKRALRAQEAFGIAGPPFGPARLFASPDGASSPQLAFGCEEGWAYLFDATTLRPLARYRSAPPSRGVPRLVGGRVVATAGEGVYALDVQTGAVSWQRTVGGEPEVTVGGATLAVRAGGRAHAIAAADGTLAWTLKGDFQFLVPPLATEEPEEDGTPWLADDGAGNLHAVAVSGRLVGDPVPVGGEPLAVLATGARSFLVATRGGRLLGVAWESETAADAAAEEPVRRLVTSWEKDMGEPLVELQLAGESALVQTAAGDLASIALATQQEGWRLSLDEDVRILARPRADAILILGADALQVRDAAMGELRHRQPLPSPALAADVRGTLPLAPGLPVGEGRLRWLDRLGWAHEARLGGAQEVITTDLGVTLADAAPVEAGFLVTTAAGEVGLVQFDREE